MEVAGVLSGPAVGQEVKKPPVRPVFSHVLVGRQQLLRIAGLNAQTVRIAVQSPAIQARRATLWSAVSLLASAR